MSALVSEERIKSAFNLIRDYELGEQHLRTADAYERQEVWRERAWQRLLEMVAELEEVHQLDLAQLSKAEIAELDLSRRCS